MTQNFDISVTPLGHGNQYLVRIEDKEDGVPLAEEQVEWPIEDWLRQTSQLMSDPLLGLLQGNAVAPTAADARSDSDVSLNAQPTQTASRGLVALGQQLYEALFQGMIRDSWVRAQGIAHNRQDILRLRLGLRGSRLQRLPWEVMHEGDRPLATGTDVTFSRYQSGLDLIDTRPSNFTHQLHQPLRILMVIAVPNDQDRLALAEEAHALQAELCKRNRTGMSADESIRGASIEIELTVLEQPGREQLTQALEQGHYQVLHYSGHSNLGKSGGSLYLVSEKTGLTEILSGEDLAGLLVNNGIRMAVFNSCRGSYTAASDPNQNLEEQNLAQALVKRGIPGVLAMAERIPDHVALTLTQLLYRNLKQGYPVDLSLSRARQGLISAYGSDQFYWALPILYQHPAFDGYLMGSQVRVSNSLSENDLLQTTSLADLDFLVNDVSFEIESPHPSAETASNPVARGLDPDSIDPLDEDPEFQAPLEDWTDMVEDLEYGESSYADDAALVAELVQLSQPAPLVEEDVMSDPASEVLLPKVGQADELGIYPDLPESPHYPKSLSRSPHPSATVAPVAEELNHTQ
ncbi:MAG: CHAT domain-containing protein, partial [Cyanothece sp. SIO1E1]|nr:CHAT domain-containing protein [Cyanothece sp. SIO1E1]